MEIRMQQEVSPSVVRWGFILLTLTLFAMLFCVGYQDSVIRKQRTLIKQMYQDPRGFTGGNQLPSDKPVHATDGHV